MTLIQMKYFLAVCEIKNFTKAAQILNVTQPAISAAIRDLETECEAVLFERNRSSLELTTEGEVLRDRIRPILAQYTDLEDTINNLGLARKYVKVGFITLNGNSAFSDILTIFKEKHPDIRIDAVEDTTSNMFRMLDDGLLDVIITARIPERNQYQPYYKSFVVAESRIVFCFNKNHPLSQKNKKYVTFEEISKEPLIMLGERFNVASTIRRQMDQLGLPMNVIHTTDQAFTVERFIERNAACGFLPVDVAKRNPNLNYCDYGQQEKRRFLSIYWRSDKQQFNSVKQYLHVAKEYALSMGFGQEGEGYPSI